MSLKKHQNLTSCINKYADIISHSRQLTYRSFRENTFKEILSFVPLLDYDLWEFMHADCSEILQPKEFLFPIQIGTVFTMLRKYAISSSACAHTPILIKSTYWSKYESVYITAQHLWCCNLLIILLFYHTVSFIVPPQPSWNPINSTTAFYIVFHFAMP